MKSTIKASQKFNQQEDNIQMTNKNILINNFKSCLDILRDGEALTGEKALRNLSYLLILKLIEPRIGKQIDFDNYPFQYYGVEGDIEIHKKTLLRCSRFSNLVLEKENNLVVIIKNLWIDILQVHPSTKNIFIQDQFFNIQKQRTFKVLIDKLHSLDLSQTDYDVLGDAYEEVIKDIMTGKVLGQYFTQPLIKKMMIKLINPKIYENGQCESICDPTMGTGGFLITYLLNIQQQAKEKNINLDWDFIKNEAIYGKEIEPDTYQLAVSNMLIQSGHMFDKLDKGDSIRQPILRKFDNIIANPPFGIKGLKYNDFNYHEKNEYIPIKSDNAVSLFLQAMIYMLKINGQCAVVLPAGQDLYSKSNQSLITIRQYLMKSCDLQQVIYLPADMFSNTSIKTCVLFFVKKLEGRDVITINKKTTNIKYSFCQNHQTQKIKFYDYIPEDDTNKLLVEVSIDEISSNQYSLNYKEYIEQEKIIYCNDIIVKTLGEICIFLNKSKRQASYGKKQGTYPFFKSSMKVDSYVDEPDYNQESIIIGDGGSPNINYGINFSASDHCYILQETNKVKLKYVYYYIANNLNIINHLFNGVGLKNLSKKDLSKIQIPIPSLEKQQQVVEYCYKNNLFIKQLQDEIKQLQDEIKQNKQVAKQFLDSIVSNQENAINEDQLILMEQFIDQLE